ncbi:MAG: hypothetical protein K8R75_03220 [Deltaproteobacteria bacterium]|nr:hypothetical protein [Deltaproteobacteria bacterium]
MFSAKIREKSIEMTRYMHMLPVFLVALVVLILGTAAPNSWADDDENEIPFSKAKIFIEFNATDEDVGIQVLLDEEPWKRVKVFDPNETKILDIMSTRSLRKQGLTELFFESSEPSLDEVSLDEFLARFPEGEYEFEGRTINGVELESEAILTHVIPAGPEIISPLSLTDEPPVVDPNDLVIQWEPVSETITGSEEIEIVGYQVIVEQEEPLRVSSIDLPASVTSAMVPPEFFLTRQSPNKFFISQKF